MFEKMKDQAKNKKEAEKKIEEGRVEAIEALKKAKSFLVIAVDDEDTAALCCVMGVPNTCKIHMALQRINAEIESSLMKCAPKEIQELFDILKEMKK